VRTTVVIATRNRRKSLARTLGHLTRLDPAPPIVVVDNASTDGSPAMVLRDFPEVTLLPLLRNLGAVARTAGVLLTRTPYVAFSDDDSWWEPGAFALAEQVFEEHPDVALVAATPLVGPEWRPDSVTELMADSPLGTDGGPGPRVLGFLACAAVIRGDVYFDVGGFSPLLHFAGEEKLLAYDIAARGWKLCYVENVRARHHPAPGREHAVRRKRELRNTILIAWLRRPYWTALRITAETATCGRAGIAALLAAARRLPQALRERRKLPAEIERDIRALEEGHRH
jgi:GT2 family glycosyltransferase